MLGFYKIAGAPAAAKIIAERLGEELSGGRRVLWLLSGGSNITIEVAAAKLLPVETSAHLTIMLNDERFGPVGHKDSNMQKLLEAGFAPGRATIVPTLTSKNATLETAAENFRSAVETAFENADVIISQLGIGPDGHVAGILPDSPIVVSGALVDYYVTEQYKRVSLTFAALKKVTAAYVFTFGTDRRAQLERLRDKDLPLAEQPAQILKQLPQSFVYNDQIGQTT
jgi:6-phosphogluconolactonase/glucosamine-6-phosphate isomerase/deaminase